MFKFKIVLVLLLILGIFNGYGQVDDCDKTKVGVSVDIVDKPDNYEWLENDFGPGDKDEWNGFTARMLVQILSEYEPNITFFTIGEGSEDYHYHLKASLTLTIVGKEDNNEHTGYFVIAPLIANADCVPNHNWVLAAEEGEDRDLKQAMKNMVSQFWPMDRNIIAYEKDHPSAPRDPQLTIDIEKEFISPLDKESRKTKVNAEVYDCRGNLVCDQGGDGQPVYYQDYIERLDLKIGNCEGGYHLGDFMVIVTYKDCNNEGEYILEKGIEAEKKNIQFKTCQLGGPLVEVEEELIIRGLEITVKPDRKELKPDERTKIILTFNETDPDGSKYPVEGKDLNVKINGLENGTLKAENGYTTDSDGKVVLNYKAGSNDERILVTASYQPEDYPDKAEGKGTVIVKPAEYEAEVTITKNYDKTLNTDQQDNKGEVRVIHKLNENIHAAATLYLKLTQVADMPVYNQTWEYYKPVSVNITSFNYNSNENKNSTGKNYETNIDYTRIVKNREISQKEYTTMVPWILAIDNDTGKVVKIVPGGCTIDYEIMETKVLNSVIYSKDGPDRDSETTTKTRDKKFVIGPVGEEIPDPTVAQSDTWIKDYIKDQGIELPPGVTIPEVSNQETIKEIPPDILVSTGDGKRTMGGSGSRTIPKKLDFGQQVENFSYTWNMTRVEKN
ncbi:MAG: hypothetical protein KJO05_12135 [Bacteroidia bacterium]|nr:hypothetical protein [Bacteroidia bacterium]NNJ80961.1 hypothetical protein [Flavobacteriaceae bacterium]NNM09489.1 hypothetical protein [Flavobacteriaceae bacterium]